MSEVLRGLAISAGILLPIVVLIIVVSMAAVKRGEAAMRGDVHGAHGGLHELTPSYVPAAAGSATATAPAKAAKPAATTEEVSVIEILGMGFLLFAVTVLLLLGISIIRHL